VDQVGVSHGSR
jgi:hypothetical protein